MKIVVNIDYGNFDLSNAAINEINKLKGKNFYNGENIDTIARDDKDLVDVVERLGERANSIESEDGRFCFTSEIRIIEIPDGVKWEIMNYDGIEYVQEVGRKWVHWDDDYWTEHLKEYILVGIEDV